MALRIEHVFSVRAPIERVWAFLADPARMALALPGVEVTQAGDRTYAGTITVKVGPISARYRGSARFISMDAAARTMEMSVSVQDEAGRGGAEVRMTSRIVERPKGEAEVSIVSEADPTGILAQLGEAPIRLASNEIFRKFSDAVRVELEQTAPVDLAVVAAIMAEHAPPPVLGRRTGPLRRVASAGPGSTARALRHPGFWLVCVAIVVALWWSCPR
jgi:uncharacterized protein